MGRVKDYIIWYEDKYGTRPNDMSAIDEYLADSERAFATISDRLKSDAKAGRPSDSNFDVFISHATEDKDAFFVRPLVAELENRKVRVWYDENEAKIGSSVLRSIDAGLTKSRFGIVILVWSKNSNGLKWRDLGFCTDSLFEWASPIQKQRLQSRFHEVIDYRRIQDALGASARLCHRNQKRYPPLSLRFKVGQVGQFHGTPNIVNGAKATT
jgi:hypothetical protein